MVRFKFLSGDKNYLEYGGLFISNRLNNGDWDYWLVIELLNWCEAVGENEAPSKYNVSLHAIAPSQVPEELMKKALDGYDFVELNTKMQVEALYQYGTRAQLWNKNGTNIKKLMRDAHAEAQNIEMLFGLYMDKSQNAIGSTGWDFLHGDTLAGPASCHTPEADIVRKMSGFPALDT